MRKSLFWLVVILIAVSNWDLLEREIELITQVPITFTVALLIAIPLLWLISRTVFSIRIDNLKSNNETLQTDKKSLEDRLKVKDEEIIILKEECSKLKEENAARIKDSEQKIPIIDKAKEPELQQKLTDIEIKVLEFVKAFELVNPTEPNQFPHECSVDEAASKLEVEWGQTNETFRKLKRLNFATSLWEGQATYLDLNRPVNEEKPIRLTTEGKDYLKAHRQNPNLG